MRGKRKLITLTGLILGVWFLLGPYPVSAQRHVDRMVVFNPLEKGVPNKDGAVQWLSGFYGSGNFGKYIGPKDNDHEWHHRVGLGFEILRWHGRNAIALTTHASFIYDPNNSINFNPRAAFWEEGLVYTRQYKDFDLQLTYLHRCKHDIDNLDVGQQRSTIFSSLESRLLFNEWETGFGKLRLTPGLDLYTTPYDDRKPEKWQGTGINWEELACAVNLNYYWEKPISQNFSLFLSGYGKASFFGNGGDLIDRYTNVSRLEWNGAAYGGIAITKDANFRIGLRIERFADSGIPVEPKQANLLSFTIQGMAPEVFY